MTRTTTPTLARTDQWCAYSKWSLADICFVVLFSLADICFVVLFSLLIVSILLCLAADTAYQETTQAKLWECTLDPEHRESGKPWKSYHLTASYESARKLTAERMLWDDETFTVSPCVKHYQDTLNVVYQP